jgi:hypothetical protein
MSPTNDVDKTTKALMGANIQNAIVAQWNVTMSNAQTMTYTQS